LIISLSPLENPRTAVLDPKYPIDGVIKQHMPKIDLNWIHGVEIWIQGRSVEPSPRDD